MKREKPFVPAILKAIQTVGSQAQLAVLTGIPQGTISRWITGKVEKLPYDAPLKIQRATRGKVSAREFLE